MALERVCVCVFFFGENMNGMHDIFVYSWWWRKRRKRRGPLLIGPIRQKTNVHLKCVTVAIKIIYAFSKSIMTERIINLFFSAAVAVASMGRKVDDRSTLRKTSSFKQVCEFPITVCRRGSKDLIMWINGLQFTKESVTGLLEKRYQQVSSLFAGISRRGERGGFSSNWPRCRSRT